MSEDRHPAPVSPERANTVLQWLGDLVRQGRLAWRLFWDPRVSFWAKLIPPAAIIYALFPLDILPDMALGLGQLDDIAALLIGIKLFIEVAPPEIVREHLIALGAHIKEWRVVEEEKAGPPAVVEGEYEITEAETAELEGEEIEEAEMGIEEA